MKEKTEASQKKEKSFGGQVLAHGILVGLVLSCVLFFRHIVSLPVSAPLQWTECLLLLALTAFCSFRFSRTDCGRKAGYGKRFAFVLLVAITGLMLYSLAMYIYSGFVDTDMQQRCLALQRKHNAAGGFNETELMETVKPSYIAFSVFFLGSLFSALCAGILAMFGRKTKKNTSKAENGKLID